MSGLDALHQLAASASEVHSSTQRTKSSNKLRVELKSEEERARKRQLRLLKNRQSAALSRQRKKEYITDLEMKAGALGTDKSSLEHKVSALTALTLEYKSQVEKLEKRLQDVTQENIELKYKISVSSGQQISSNESPSGTSPPSSSSPECISSPEEQPPSKSEESSYVL